MSLNLTELRLNIQKLNDKLAEKEQIIKIKDKEVLKLYLEKDFKFDK